ncbi:MAG TPA: tRNA isopentenyl-2-thiomethyl-A-37 hydroxylase MiaE [Pseudomonadales bacterium]|nr:tRNA isopentenyl-2-thiomethyl-A-37 hydroxylase MiaE [Pseudomonadales bacterium]
MTTVDTLFDIAPIADFLLCRTPQAWIDRALQEQALMLVDHANCEKKAASTALGLMYRHIDCDELLNKLSRLAREELRHFEQVIAIMKKRGVTYEHVTASRYAAGLHSHAAKRDPERLVDTLIMGAIIEARSCERFSALAPHLDPVLQKFYLSLLKSESRHFMDYLSLARKYAQSPIDERVQLFLERERELIEGKDQEFRFHSGVPV